MATHIGKALGALAVLTMIAVGLGSTADGQEPARPGLGCVRNSECQSPQVCKIGRCMEECRVNRDCGPGQTCVQAASPYGRLGVCQIPAIDKRALCNTEKMTCVFARDCTSGRCTNGLCQ